MATIRYLLPVSDSITALPWQRSDNSQYTNVYQVVNDQPGYPSAMASEPALNGDTWALGYWETVAAPQPISLFTFNGDIPGAAINLRVRLRGYFGSGNGSPMKFALCLSTATGPEETPSATPGLYQVYTWDLGATHPQTMAAWTPTTVNTLVGGFKRTNQGPFGTRCATFWAEVTYDLPAAGRPRRGSAVLL